MFQRSPLLEAILGILAHQVQTFEIPFTAPGMPPEAPRWSAEAWRRVKRRRQMARRSRRANRRQ